MDVSDITPQLEQLEEELNKAQETFGPLLGDIGDISSKLPLLDKAKLYVLVSYTIESLLFCKFCSFRPSSHSLTPNEAALRLNGVETKNHAIFTELTRVKQYMEKIQKLETPAPARENTVNTEAAARFIKSDLVSNHPANAPCPDSLTRRRVTTRRSKTNYQNSLPESGQMLLPKPPRRNARQRSLSQGTAQLKTLETNCLRGRSATGARRRNEKFRRCRCIVNCHVELGRCMAQRITLLPDIRAHASRRSLSAGLWLGVHQEHLTEPARGSTSEGHRA